MKILEVISEAIGPGAGQELELLLSGSKPAALMFDYQIETAKWQEAIRKNGWAVERFTGGGQECVAISKDPARARLIKKLVTDMWTVGAPTRSYHIQLGKALGYSTKDILHFLVSIGWAKGLNSLKLPWFMAALRTSAGSILRGALGMPGFLATWTSDLNAGEDEWLDERDFQQALDDVRQEMNKEKTPTRPQGSKQ